MIIKGKKTLPKVNKKLKLVTILVGKNNLSEIFIKKKKQVCEKIGLDFELCFFPSSVSLTELKKQIKQICQRKSVSGVIIQLPLPKKMQKKEQEILDLVPPQKDIDVLSSANLGKYYLSPIVQAVAYLLKKQKVKIQGKHVVLVGYGRLTGIPLSLWFLKKQAHISVLNKYTKDISYFTKKADVLISATGQPNLIKKTMLKKGSVVIDIGNCLVNGKIKGDIEFSEKPKYFIPAVGGIGPVTVAYLIENLIKFNES